MAKPLILVNGSGTIKAGLTSVEQDVQAETCPSLVFDNVVYHQSLLRYHSNENGIFVGSPFRGQAITSTSHPVEHGFITNGKNMKKVWRHAFAQLEVDPSEHPVLLVESTLNSKDSRAWTTKMMFEKFSVPSFYLVHKAVVSLRAQGLSTGLAVSVGHGHSQVVPVYEGYALNYAQSSVYWAGDELTERLGNLLHTEYGHCFKTVADKKVLRDIKEKLCSVSMKGRDDEDKPLGRPQSKSASYTLPDGRSIEVDPDRLATVVEPLFDSSEGLSITDLIGQSLLKCPEEICDQIGANIVLSGGTAQMDGFQARLERELAKHSDQLKVVSPLVDQSLSPWYGACKLSCQPEMDRLWITRKDYDECGPYIVNRMCF